MLQVLYGKNLLKPDSQILKMNLGYSTIIQITQTQVFAPTWEIRIRLADKTEETYFLNAENGKIVDIQNDLLEEKYIEAVKQVTILIKYHVG